MWFKRLYENENELLKEGKVNLLYGPRRVGKTALVKQLLKTKSDKVFFGEGDDLELRDILGSNLKSKILTAFQNYDCIFIDEAQRIPDIGWGLKILVDNLPNLLIVASGSSSFELSKKVGAPLTGRTNTRLLYPVSVAEINEQFGGMYVMQMLENFMLFGMYPEVLISSNKTDKIRYLSELRNSYLLKDVLELENIRNANKLYDLLRLLAFQIGKEVSLNELSKTLELSVHTVSRYLDLLEKVFVIKKISGFSKNLRKEVTKTSRYYFFDNGIRNSLINNYNPLSARDDSGMLWENFLVMERLKKNEYKGVFSNNYFWRTYDQKEVDFVEERDGNLYGYEFKWGLKKGKIQKEFLNTYANSSFEIINKDNFLEFVL
jgi:predicted AAA+ superfamily ATPase